MPAEKRGGSPSKAAPRAKAPSNTDRRVQANRSGAAEELRPFMDSAKHVLFAATGVLAVALVITLATGGRAQLMARAIRVGIDNQFAAAGFKLRAIHVEGASPMATPDIIRAAGVYKDQPLMGLDLKAVRARVEQVGWVREVRVVRLLPDTLVLAVRERPRLAIWQHAGKSVVIDDKGAPIREADPGRFPKLPLVVGAGGAEHAPGLVPLLAEHPRLMARMVAAVRVDNRRWDLRMKDGALVQLPASDEAAALIQLERLDQRSRILTLGFERIDLRNPDVVAVRPRQTAAAGGITAGGV
jgi:cell division protein FtsQ